YTLSALAGRMLSLVGFEVMANFPSSLPMSMLGDDRFTILSAIIRAVSRAAGERAETLLKEAASDAGVDYGDLKYVQDDASLASRVPLAGRAGLWRLGYTRISTDEVVF